MAMPTASALRPPTVTDVDAPFADSCYTDPLVASAATNAMFGVLADDLEFAPSDDISVALQED